MRTLLNVLWVIFGGGLVIALEYLLAGLLLCITVVGIPFGVQCFKLAAFSLWPFGRSAEVAPGHGPVGCVLNALWLVVAGIWIFLSHLSLALALFVTLIGIPFGVQHVKLALLALTPFGRVIRES